jgi:hypothetical protein
MSVSRFGDLKSNGGVTSLLPQSSSISECNFSCRIPRLHKNPTIEIPSSACQTTLSASADVFRTGSFNDELSVGMIGIAENLTWKSRGN